MWKCDLHKGESLKTADTGRDKAKRLNKMSFSRLKKKKIKILLHVRDCRHFLTRALKHSAISEPPTADSHYSETDEEQFLKDLRGIYLY